MGEMEGTEDIPRAGPAWSQLCRQTRYGGSAPTGRHEVGQDKLASSKDYCSLPATGGWFSWTMGGGEIVSFKEPQLPSHDFEIWPAVSHFRDLGDSNGVIF
jgi:hypothetical protein